MQIPEPELRTHNRARATQGFTLFSPVQGDRVFLIDMDGQPVHEWKLQGLGGINRCQLTDDGTLFVTQSTLAGPPLMAGKGGLPREYNWHGDIVWEHHDENHHHEAMRLATGNTLYIAREAPDDATARRVRGGRRARKRTERSTAIPFREIDPAGNTVREWRLGDAEVEKYPICGLCNRSEFGHANTCAPLADGNVMLSFRALNLICTVDRRSGRIVWEMCDQILGHQHDCTGSTTATSSSSRTGFTAIPTACSRISSRSIRTRRRSSGVSSASRHKASSRPTFPASSACGAATRSFARAREAAFSRSPRKGTWCGSISRPTRPGRGYTKPSSTGSSAPTATLPTHRN